MPRDRHLERNATLAQDNERVEDVERALPAVDAAVIEEPHRPRGIADARFVGRMESLGVDRTGHDGEALAPRPEPLTDLVDEAPPPISNASAVSSTRCMARRWVWQHDPTQWPSPPWIDTTTGIPDRFAARTAAQPVG